MAKKTSFQNQVVGKIDLAAIDGSLLKVPCPCGMENNIPSRATKEQMQLKWEAVTQWEETQTVFSWGWGLHSAEVPFALITQRSQV